MSSAENLTAISAAVGGLLAGLAGMVGMKRSNTKRIDGEADRIWSELVNQGNRITKAETHHEDFMRRFDYYIQQEAEQSKAIFGKLDDLNESVNRMKGRDES